MRSSEVARRGSPTWPMARPIRSRQAAVCGAPAAAKPLFHLHGSPTTGRVHPLLEIGLADVHSSWAQILFELAFLQLVSHLGDAATPQVTLHREVAPGSSTGLLECFHTLFCQWSALHSTHFKNLVVDSNTMLGCANDDQATLPLPTKHPMPRSFQKNDACATRLALQTPDLLHMHLLAKQPLATCWAIRTLHALGQDVRHTLHK